MAGRAAVTKRGYTDKGRADSPYARAYAAKTGAKVYGRTSAEHVAKNRERASSTGRAYVIFLALMSVLTVLMCVYYLRLKATVTQQLAVNEKLESRLVSMRSENDALRENVMNSIDWNEVREVAIDKLGMQYATEEQIVWYNTDDSSYIRQYGDVPR